MRHSQTFNGVDRLPEFTARALQKFKPGRSGKEQIPHFNTRAQRMGSRFGRAYAPTFDRYLPGFAGPTWPTGDGHAADGTDSGQRLAPKTQRRDTHKIIVW